MTKAEHPMVNRARLLLLAVLGAAIWVVLSVLGSGSPASAADETDIGDSLLGTVTDTVEGLPVVSAATSPLVSPVTAAVEEVAEPATATVQHVAPATVTATVDTLHSAEAIVETAVHAVLQQPLVATTVGWLTDAMGGVAEALPGDAGTTAGAGAAVRFAETGPFPAPGHHAGATARSGIPTASQHGAADAPRAPSAPSGPVSFSFDTAASAQNPGGQPLAAALESRSTAALDGTTTSVANDPLPPSVTFDTDCSPD